jgi:hypothetical protein
VDHLLLQVVFLAVEEDDLAGMLQVVFVVAMNAFGHLFCRYIFFFLKFSYLLYNNIF